jgi:hypothetical protein
MRIIGYGFTNGSKVVCVVPLLLEFDMDYYRVIGGIGKIITQFDISRLGSKPKIRSMSFS